MILWGRVCRRGFDAALVAVVVFAVVTCVVGPSNVVPFSETWWGRHLLALLLGFVTLPVLVAAGLLLLRQLRLPLDELPELESGASGAGSETYSGMRRLPWRAKVALAAVIAVPVLPGLFYLEENSRGERAWNQYKREQEAHGEQMDLAALVPPPVPDDQNFAATPFLAPLFDFLPGTQQPRDPVAADCTKSLSPRYEAAAYGVRGRRLAVSNSWVLVGIDLPAWHAALTASGSYTLDFREPARVPAVTNAPAVAEAAAGVLAALAEAEPVLEELRAASRRPYSRFNLRYDIDNPATLPLPHYAVLKRAVQVLQLRASAELALGRTDQAFEDIQFMFRMADATRNEPLLIGHLVRLASMNLTLEPLAEGLARHQWSEAQLHAFEERLRGFDFLADGRQTLHGEGIFFGGIIDYVRRSPNKQDVLKGIGLESGNNQPLGFSGQSAVLAAVPSGWFYLEQVNYSRTFQDYLLPAIDVPGRRVNPGAYDSATAHVEALSSDPWPVRVLQRQFFCGMMLPALSIMLLKTALAQAGADCAALACALERYRLARGQFPESLGALVPEFISQAPHDVINGQPLHYRCTPDGQYVLYSVGWDATDDGGVFGRGGSHLTGDWVWRLPAR